MTDTPMPKARSQNGYTLIEMVMVVVILGVLSAIAFKSMGKVTEVTRTEETRQKMDRLAWAITGDRELVSGGSRIDFGYVGDIGALPPTWDALVANPGSYTTWKGPYIQDKFAAGAANSDFMVDAWGKPYSAPNSITFTSSGGPSTVTRRVANSTADLLYNRVILTILDLDNGLPGSVKKDSVKFLLTFPNGVGSTSTVTKFPTANGLARFDSIPVGIHDLRVIFIPTNETLSRKITVFPGRTVYADLHHYAKVW